jgi:hypothetical protein
VFTICHDETENSPVPIFERLCRTHIEMGELKEMLGSGLTLAFMLRAGEFKLDGRHVLGAAYLLGSGGTGLKPLYNWLLEERLGYLPTFLIILSADWWAEATDTEREILVFHEALHCGHAHDQYGSPRFNRQTGEPVPCMVPHSLEEFHQVARRYGAWRPDIATFVEAVLGSDTEDA